MSQIKSFAKSNAVKKTPAVKKHIPPAPKNYDIDDFNARPIQLKFLKPVTPLTAEGILHDLYACEEPEELAHYISIHFGEISLEASELFFHFINR